MPRLWLPFVLFVSVLTVDGGAALISQPVPASQKNNFFQDLDANGLLDHVLLTLLDGVDSSYLEDDLDSIVFSWVDSSGDVIGIPILGRNFQLATSDSRVLCGSIVSDGLYPGLTSVGVAGFGGYGTATLYARDALGGQVSLPVRMRDGMPPLVWTASLALADDESSEDRLLVTFSEAVFPVAEFSNDSLFDLKTADGAIRALRFSSLEWVSSSFAILYFGSDIPSSLRPTSQDSIRIHAGALVDVAANAPVRDSIFSLNNSDSRPFTAIVGDFQFKIHT
ncbi:MAG TPA: hypothetical protein VLM37_10060, partial [Fibrobacteraceae bacterium]|nr:hypothetical protein [Fibrobacteraceae bacterium]